MAQSTGREIANLQRMTPAQLRVRYAEVFGEQTRSGSYNVVPDERWGDDWFPPDVIFSQRRDADDSKIRLTFSNKTQFTVEFERGRAVLIERVDETHPPARRARPVRRQGQHGVRHDTADRSFRQGQPHHLLSATPTNDARPRPSQPFYRSEFL